MNEQQLPEGWTEEMIRKLAEHHDNMTEDEIADEIDPEELGDDETVMVVPTALVPEINKLIDKLSALPIDMRR